MRILVDGDACPKAIKTILFKAANRTKIQLLFIANHFVNLPPSPFIKRCIVSSGFDVADKRIIEELERGDLVITGDIPLADAVVSKQGIALSPRGKLFSAENIKSILAMRNVNEVLRDSGLISGGGAKLSAKDIQDFSNHLDRILTRARR
jgi:uncharacterized protein YaiI (UPF0178 family)